MSEEIELKQGLLQGASSEMKAGNRMLLVVGRGFSGKTSFVRMLVREDEKRRLEEAIQNKENGCQIYKSDKFTNIFGGDIEVLDTPGVTSKESMMAAIEEIEEIVLRRKGDIVGIAILMNIRQREVTQERECFLLSYLNLLRLRLSAKRALGFCVISKFDFYYQQEEANHLNFAEFKQLFDTQGLPEIWQRKLLWMSEPNRDKNRFQQKVQGVLKSYFQQQLPNLQKILKQNLQKGILNYDLIQEDYNRFFYNFKNQFLREYKSMYYKEQSCPVNTKVTIKAQEGRLNLLLTVGIIGFCLLVGKLINSSVAGSAIGGIFLVSYFIQRFNKRYSGQILREQNPYKVQSRQSLSNMIKVWITQAASPQITMKNNLIQVTKTNNIASMQCFNNKKQIEVKLISNKYNCLLLPRENQVIINYKLPSNECFLQFTKKIGKDIYHRK